MDTITHGIAGALVGKAFFAERYALDPQAAPKMRLATLAATLGGVFPDSDSLVGLFSGNGLAVISTHRAETHSLLLLPLWALALAGVTRWLCRRRGYASPSLAGLTVIYAAGIALHILLDLITSFGTMIWAPLNYARVSWDLTFIIDVIFTGIVLLPQVAAWVYRDRTMQLLRALFCWGLFTLLIFGLQAIARAVEIRLSPWTVSVAGLLLAALFFLPAVRGWGFRVPRGVWCRAGVLTLGIYLVACLAANRAALRQVQEYAARQGLAVQEAAAIPMPPSLGHWSGLIRTADGVHFTMLNLRSERSPKFGFYGHAASNPFIERARQLPAVQSYLRFARFPVVRYVQRDNLNVVELIDLRFFGRTRRGPQPFTFHVVFDAQGGVISSGWAEE